MLPRLAAKVLALAVAMGHAYGSGTWLTSGLGTYWVFPFLFIGSALLVVWTWERADRLGAWRQGR